MGKRRDPVSDVWWGAEGLAGPLQSSVPSRSAGRAVRLTRPRVSAAWRAGGALGAGDQVRWLKEAARPPTQLLKAVGRT